MKNDYKIWVGKLQEKMPFEIIMSRRDINIKINTGIIESRCEDVGWI
jgi:hypothetical protein